MKETLNDLNRRNLVWNKKQAEDLFGVIFWMFGFPAFIVVIILLMAYLINSVT